MTAYFVGDIPAEDLVIEPARAGMAIDLAPFDTATVTLRDPAGVAVDSTGFLATIVGDTVEVEWPDETVLQEPGVYEISILLEGDDATERLTPVRVVVEPISDGWYTLDTAREDWDDAPSDDSRADLVLHDLLEAAKLAVLTYAPALAEDARPPYAWRKAQLMQARNTWNVDSGDAGNTDMGLGGFVYTPKPLEWHVKQLIRPKGAVPPSGESA